MDTFANALFLFDRYFRAQLAERSQAFDATIGNEVRRRLRQLSHLAAEVGTLSEAVLAKADPERPSGILIFASTSPPPDCSDDERRERVRVPLGVEEHLQLVTESFYYLAGRLLTILQQCRNSLPHVPDVVAGGVLRVRNNLIEHANKKSGETVVSFALTRSTGPCLRALSEIPLTPHTHRDRGFTANVTELRTSLDRAFQAALDASTADAFLRDLAKP